MSRELEKAVVEAIKEGAGLAIDTDPVHYEYIVLKSVIYLGKDREPDRTQPARMEWFLQGRGSETLLGLDEDLGDILTGLAKHGFQIVASGGAFQCGVIQLGPARFILGRRKPSPRKSPVVPTVGGELELETGEG